MQTHLIAPKCFTAVIPHNDHAESPHLNVIVRVPVRVIDDDGVSCSKVDAKSASSRRQKEGKGLGTSN